MRLGAVKLMPRGKRILAAMLVLAAAGLHGGKPHVSRHYARTRRHGRVCAAFWGGT